MEAQKRACKPQCIGLKEEIHKIALEFPKYGYRRITHALYRSSISANHKRVLWIMREENLFVRKKRLQSENNTILSRVSQVSKSCEKCWTDRNKPSSCKRYYLHKPALRVHIYLAVIMDLFSRRCVGWALSCNPDADLTLEAFWTKPYSTTRFKQHFRLYTSFGSGSTICSSSVCSAIKRSRNEA